MHIRHTPGPDGTPAVYVHGLGGSSTNWTDLAA
ncbi:alpha/beta hydrolase, partial [Amycolatopsis sp. NPDC003676]